ncbi:hypothetical protein C9374_008701 [Naegleria lovaniensis]|uniref:Nudix hydrolase domain-containing protein n=1 Tax=Naegleria lovaniensis TaxID=51637 RepID=A0AA88GIF8_NAELO|nr:uncharacterized protein C9374_008701 [Naegleria lovaniensis]KAG2378079.1 hypothetical protein C9374_008701 [Naegleria lovaniensis]
MFKSQHGFEKYCFSVVMQEIGSCSTTPIMRSLVGTTKRNLSLFRNDTSVIRLNCTSITRKSMFMHRKSFQIFKFSDSDRQQRYYHESLHRLQSSSPEQTQEMFPNLKNFLKMDSSRIDFFEVLKSIDFQKNEKQRPTFHEYNNSGQKLKLSRRPDPSARSSAVMVLFFKRGEKGEPFLVLLQKTPAKKNTNYQHAGQISFPGGVFDSTLDSSLLDTAIRETNEEIGQQHIQVLNESLPSTMTGARNFNVKPFIGRLLQNNEQTNAEFHYLLQTDEIEHLFEVKVLDLIQNSNFEPLGKTIINSSFTHYGPVFHLTNVHSVTRNTTVPYASRRVTSELLNKCKIVNNNFIVFSQPSTSTTGGLSRNFHQQLIRLDSSNVGVASAQACPYHKTATSTSSAVVVDQPPAHSSAMEVNTCTTSESKPPLKSFQDLPGPKPLPLIGNLWDLLKNKKKLPNAYFLELCEQYGYMVKLTLPKNNMLIISHPDIIEELMRKEERRDKLVALRYVKEQHNIELLPIELRYDEDWQPIRSLFNIAMKPENSDKVSLPQLTELNGDFLRIVADNLKTVVSSKDGETKYLIPNAFGITSLYTFKAVTKVFLGIKVDEEVEKLLPWKMSEFVDAAVRSTDVAIGLDTKPPLYKLYKTREYKEMEDLLLKVFIGCREFIKAFAKNPNPNLPRLKDLIDERAAGMENPERKVEGVLTAFINGGVDITSRMMVNQFYRLAHHPDYQEKLYQELVQVFGEPSAEEFTSEQGLHVSLEQYKKLKLSKNFFEEILRIDPFSYMTSGRWLREDTELNGYLIPKDTRVLVVNYYPNLKEEFVPRAKEFIPERHEKGSPLAPKSLYISLPFGIGARKCPGSRIASTENHMALINLVRHFKLSHGNPEKFPEPAMDQSLLYIDTKNHPLYLVPRDHLKPVLEQYLANKQQK